ncbi:transmembrane protein, putative (macronuclear) [Tetrahymena thermophila SB210]|uniref:Transmembrane protein, putative n=1 Tax=Tetrahymena thermophila (strain SB210) TaxID=312017 RepID=Q239Z8_TETTS|nr:transmembrane protein, putative [Tetrahymena thermophila SB210]EAR93365.2 transmembrane protein, putative [Tetrahymena thermophila SB210]|eukprot:XP_001013610.2 transmembrane protein, putative [Tetrahymena thermophila SB210]
MTQLSTFNIILNIFTGSILNGLYINYLAIDTTQYNFIYISDMLTEQVNMQLNNNFYSYTFYVQYQLPQVAGQILKKVQAFLTGFETQKQVNTNSNDKFSIYFKITSQNLTGFNVTVSQQKGSLLIQSVQYNFIEINEDPYGNIQTDLLNQSNFEDASQISCFNDPDKGNTCDYYNQNQSFNRSLSLIIPLNHSVQSNQLNFINLFTGLNTFTVYKKFPNNELNNPRLQLGNYTLQNQNQEISISYYVWYNTTVISIASQGIAIFQKQCNPPLEILNKNVCISQATLCDQGTYLNNKTCSLCDTSCAACSNQASSCTLCQADVYLFVASCQKSQPSGYYCEKQPNLSYICTTPCQDTNCASCSSQNKNSCTACQNKQYLFQSTCLPQKPPQTYCDNNNSCTKCIDTNCLDCSKNSEQICNQCQSSLYLFNGQCLQNQPDGTYCDQNKQCQACSDSLCLDCKQNANICQKCQPNVYKLGQNCQKTKPDQANCIDYECKSSGICQTQDQAGNCSQCISGNFLYKNLCYDQQPINTCCDTNKQCVDSNIPNCQSCFAQSPTLRACNQCQSGYYLYNNQCWSIQPSQTYCNSQLICTQCSKILKNCLYCDDPSKVTQCLKCQNDNNNCLSNQMDDQNSQCHFSCDKCFGSASNECLSCASTTRQLDQQQNTCACKPGYSSVQDYAQCWDDDLTANQELQQLGDYSIQLYFIFSLPFLVTNFHPFCDAYIYTLQLIGNFGIVSSKHFWFLLEVRKIIITILICSINLKDVTSHLDISLKQLGRSSTFNNNNNLKISNLLITPRQTIKI